MTFTDWAAVFVAVAVPLISWVFSRITKARQAETHAAIRSEVSNSGTALTEHIDQQIAGVNTRLDGFGRELTRVDAEGRANAEEIAYLRGALNMPSPRAAVQVAPTPAAGQGDDH